MRKAGDIILDMFKDRFGPGFMENARSTAGLFSSWARVVAEVWPPEADEEKAEPAAEAASRGSPPEPAAGCDLPAAAQHSRICELERGVLLVEADHPGWIQILQTRQTELLSVVRRRHPEQDVRRIAFRLSRTPMPGVTADVHYIKRNGL